MSRSWGASVAGYWSPPATFKAMTEVADGYPDSSGKNTAVSLQFAQHFVVVFVRHGATGKGSKVVADAQSPKPVALQYSSR
jgi:hypothetical protein